MRVIEDDEVEEEEEDEEIEDDDGYQIWPEAEEEGDGDYDEDEAEEEWERFVAPVDRARQNRSMMVNAMNSDGSSPPKGSIYISSMPREIKLACMLHPFTFPRSHDRSLTDRTTIMIR